MPISDELLEILVCPLSRKPLVYDPAADALISTDPETRRRYSIQTGYRSCWRTMSIRSRCPKKNGARRWRSCRRTAQTNEARV